MFAVVSWCILLPPIDDGRMLASDRGKSTLGYIGCGVLKEERLVQADMVVKRARQFCPFPVPMRV